MGVGGEPHPITVGGPRRFFRARILAGNSNFGGKFNFFLRKIQILNKSIKTVIQSILNGIGWTMEWYKVNERTKKEWVSKLESECSCLETTSQTVRRKGAKIRVY